MLVCADCKSPLHFHFNQKKPDIEYYNCKGNNCCHPICSKTHYIRADFLEEVVLADIRRIIKYVNLHEKKFVQYLIQQSKQDTLNEKQQFERAIKSLVTRYEELDRLYERLYEDNVNGKINDERFTKLSGKYEVEQKEVKAEIARKQGLLDTTTEHLETVDEFISIAKRHAKIKKLSSNVLHQFVHHIEAYHAEVIDGEKQQRVKIFYNCVGTLDLPSEPDACLPQIKLETRKGVAISYSQSA